MPVTRSEYAYIPSEKITSVPKASVPEGPTRIFSEFSVIGDNSEVSLGNQPMTFKTVLEAASSIFSIEDLPEGKLFTSKRSYVEDTEGNRIPRALLITNQGRKLIRDNPGLLQQIDQGSDKERSPKTQLEDTDDDIGEGYSGIVTILDLEDIGSVAIKRFKRHHDGKRLDVGGLEIAKLGFTLIKSSLADQMRLPDIFFASQDVLVMENIETKELAENAAENNDVISEQLFSLKERIKSEIPRILKRHNIKGDLDTMLDKHLYIDNFDEETERVTFIWIDPLC